MDGDVFYHFVQSSLLSQLMPFNGTNPNSVVIMDNCSIHHLYDVIRLIHSGVISSALLSGPDANQRVLQQSQAFFKVT